jgi:NADH-quinone oxidoreductase subunit E
MTLSEHLLEEIRELPSRYPQPRSAVMPALDLAQEELGYLTPETMAQVAGALQLDPGYVEGVATFYTLFHLEPIGKHRFYVCTNISCLLRGAEDVVERLKKEIGVHEPGEVSKDGLFSYEEVECLGACEYAVVCRLDHRYEKDLSPDKIAALVAERRDTGRESEPAPPHPTAPATRAGSPSPQGGEVKKPTPPRSGEARRRKKADG